MANVPGTVGSIESSSIGFSGYRPAAAAAGIQPSTASTHTGVAPTFGTSPYLPTPFPNGYQATPDFSSYVANGPSATGWYGTPDSRFSKFNWVFEILFIIMVLFLSLILLFLASLFPSLSSLLSLYYC
uniref:Uncharacterized protein n=1 Tax=Syphacia muris TaxID=451379 RepID=A0A0N5AV30_9BILA